MKVVILCGGKGIRMKELTDDIPKPLAMIGDRPILWHIMKTYYQFGYRDFVLLLGYKGEKIKEYFMEKEWKKTSFLLKDNGCYEIIDPTEKWNITFLDTGLETMTGGRVKKAEALIGNESFMLTYGDGLANIDLNALQSFHDKHGKIATVTGIRKPNQYGVISVEKNIATKFVEKPISRDIINGGFFVFNPGIFHYLKDDDNCILEKEPLMKLVEDRELAVYKHNGFWKAMDTYKDILDVNKMLEKNEAAWKVW